jgi:hypothetical protein
MRCPDRRVRIHPSPFIPAEARLCRTRVQRVLGQSSPEPTHVPRIAHPAVAFSLQYVSSPRSHPHDRKEEMTDATLMDELVARTATHPPEDLWPTRAAAVSRPGEFPACRKPAHPA